MQQINFLSTLKCNFRWSVHRWPSGQLVRGLKSRATERKINICGEKRGAGGANSTVKIRDHRTPLTGLSVTYTTHPPVFSHRSSRKYKPPPSPVASVNFLPLSFPSRDSYRTSFSICFSQGGFCQEAWNLFLTKRICVVFFFSQQM